MANAPASSKFSITEVRGIPDLTRAENHSVTFALVASTVFNVVLPPYAKAVSVNTGGDLVYMSIDEDPSIPAAATSPADVSDRAVGTAVQTNATEFKTLTFDLRMTNKQVRLISASTPTIVMSFL